MDGYALLDQPRSGVENMALDQRMLEFAASEQVPLLRVYRWSEPTLSLGYFQKFEERGSHAASSRLPIVRRATGGGAIVHHHDWTYCVALPDRLTFSQQASSSIGASPALYGCLHDCVVAWLVEEGFPAHKWNQACATAPDQADRGKSFLCFERRSCGDVVVQDSKIMGSAQRRMQGAMLQHGSLLLASSPHAPSLLGLHDLALRQIGKHTASPKEITEEIKEKSPRKWAEESMHGGLPIKLEGWFGQLTTSLASAIGVDFQFVKAVGELPLEWHWPQPSKFGEKEWTKRV
jgi:lipoate-protein ligase A